MAAGEASTYRSGTQKRLADPIVVLATMIDRIDLKPGRLSVTLDAKALVETLHIRSIDCIDRDANTFTVPFEKRRRGVETRMVLGHTEPQIDTMLIANVAQARSWYAKLKSGLSLATIAEQHDTKVALVTRILPLAFLSPAIVQIICAGQQPLELTSRKLRDISIPVDWTEQAKLFQLG